MPYKPVPAACSPRELELLSARHAVPIVAKSGAIVRQHRDADQSHKKHQKKERKQKKRKKEKEKHRHKKKKKKKHKTRSSSSSSASASELPSSRSGLSMMLSASPQHLEAYGRKPSLPSPIFAAPSPLLTADIPGGAATKIPALRLC